MVVDNKEFTYYFHVNGESKVLFNTFNYILIKIIFYNLRLQNIVNYWDKSSHLC